MIFFVAGGPEAFGLYLEGIGDVGTGDISGLASTEEAAVQDLKFSYTVLQHLNDVSKQTGEFSRPYSDSILTAREIMNSGVPTPDAFLPNGLKWEVPGSYNGTEGLWQLVVDMDTNTVVHFLFISLR